MSAEYSVGFKDVYPWVWAAMLGVSLMLADKRKAFAPLGPTSMRGYVAKSIGAALLNVGVPSVIFGYTMVRLGPVFDLNMGVSETIFSLYLAGSPLGCHHLWLLLTPRRWVYYGSEKETAPKELELLGNKVSHLAWTIIALVLPTLAVIYRTKLPTIPW